MCREPPRPEAGESFREWWGRRGKASGDRFHAPRVGLQPSVLASKSQSPSQSKSPSGLETRSRDPIPGPDFDFDSDFDGSASRLTPHSPHLARYLERARAAGTEVELLTPGQLPARLRRLLAELGSPATALPARGWPPGLRQAVEEALGSAGCAAVVPERVGEGFAWDRGALAGAGLGVTPCATYLAETGSLVFPSGPGLGTLASLLPPVHLALSGPGECLPDLGSCLGTYPAGARSLLSRLQLVTGPSRTGDIEGTLSKGVHGPGRVLHWIVGG